MRIPQFGDPLGGDRMLGRASSVRYFFAEQTAPSNPHGPCSNQWYCCWHVCLVSFFCLFVCSRGLRKTLLFATIPGLGTHHLRFASLGTTQHHLRGSLDFRDWPFAAAKNIPIIRSSHHPRFGDIALPGLLVRHGKGIKSASQRVSIKGPV